MRLSALAGVCALLAMASPATAQVTASGVRDLAFGTVIRGIATHVLPNDAVKSGRFQIQSTNGTRVRLQFTLPNRLNGPSGATMPISFGATDGVLSGNAGNNNLLIFNPSTSQTVQVVPSTPIVVFLGGTVSPPANQAFGSYANTITLTVTVQ
jgi:hypothetical protein